jgi:hypothetical protein
MSTFAVTAERLTIHEHPNADASYGGMRHYPRPRTLGERSRTARSS